jgi:hypothetical protein
MQLKHLGRVLPSRTAWQRFILAVLLVSFVMWDLSAATSKTGRIDVGAATPGTCAVGDVFFQTSSTIQLYVCLATNTWTQEASTGTFANTTLSNLGTTSINSALLPSSAAGFDFGSALLPWKGLYMAGSSGTPATNNFYITGASTSGTRTVTLPDNTGTVAELNLAQTWTALQTSSSGFSDTSTTFKAKRVDCANGTSLVAGDFALSAGWGSTAAIASLNGHDCAWVGTITTGGTGIVANPTLTLTFHDGTWTNVPICITKIAGGTGSFSDITDAPTATTNVMTYNALPVSALTYIFASVCIGT